MQVTVKVEWLGYDNEQVDCDPDDAELGEIVRVLLKLGAERVIVERKEA